MRDMLDAYFQWQIDGMTWWHNHPTLWGVAVAAVAVFVIGGRALIGRGR